MGRNENMVLKPEHVFYSGGSQLRAYYEFHMVWVLRIHTEHDDSKTATLLCKHAHTEFAQEAHCSIDSCSKGNDDVHAQQGKQRRFLRKSKAGHICTAFEKRQALWFEFTFKKVVPPHTS